MNRKDNWQALLMPVSEGFHNRVEETLEQIGKEVKSLQGHRKRTRAVRSLAVALVAALLLLTQFKKGGHRKVDSSSV